LRLPNKFSNATEGGRRKPRAESLGGIGFTMSLFIASLAFDTAAELGTAKAGILAASIASGLAGTLVAFQWTRGQEQQAIERPRQTSWTTR
jgi:dolichol kinase